MVLGLSSVKKVLRKTGNKCAICGCTNNLSCMDFIPLWTRIQPTIDNSIPLCADCIAERGMNFIELGKLKYVPQSTVFELMKVYQANDKYLKFYVRKFGTYRTRGLINVNRALLVLQSYDEFVYNNWPDI